LIAALVIAGVLFLGGLALAVFEIALHAMDSFDD